jgi:hypothetical protein
LCYIDTDADSISNEYSNAVAHSNRHAHAHTYGCSKPNANGYTDSITDGYSNSNAVTDADANPVTNVNIFTLHPLCFHQKGILVARFHISRYSKLY